MKTHFPSRRLPDDASGVLVDVTPRKAGWDFIRFTVRRVTAGITWRVRARREECCVVLLRGGGEVAIDGGPARPFGPRADVFASYPHAVYVPHGHEASFRASEVSEVAECRAVSDISTLEPRLVAPADCGYEVRGGGNATRQIVDILPPAFPAHRLMICEVFTPSGNWSSYPPHKHDVDNPPVEVDLEEIYYYRMAPAAYGFQRLYASDGARDTTLKVEHGDVVLIRDGYHPFVAAYGYDAYYLNVLGGERRSMAASDDPRYAMLRGAWPPADPRVPVVPRP